jgi:hypothetical protein
MTEEYTMLDGYDNDDVDNYFHDSVRSYYISENILLADKHSKLEEYDIYMKNIRHIIAFLPNKELNQNPYSIPYTVLEYIDEFDKDKYDEYALIINNIINNGNNGNVIVLCNDEYKQSIKFLTYYFVKYDKLSYDQIYCKFYGLLHAEHRDVVNNIIINLFDNIEPGNFYRNIKFI